jgi:anthranilate synthase component 2
MQPDGIVLSPGPGHPADKKPLEYAERLLKPWDQNPVLGVCLGHQGMYVYGGKVINARSKTWKDK